MTVLLHGHLLRAVSLLALAALFCVSLVIGHRTRHAFLRWPIDAYRDANPTTFWIVQGLNALLALAFAAASFLNFWRLLG
jgi:hypothetical protein